MLFCITVAPHNGQLFGHPFISIHFTLFSFYLSFYIMQYTIYRPNLSRPLNWLNGKTLKIKTLKIKRLKIKGSGDANAIIILFSIYCSIIRANGEKLSFFVPIILMGMHTLNSYKMEALSKKGGLTSPQHKPSYLILIL